MRRPPWWPQDEPFPPEGRPGPEAWRAMRGRFVRRAVLFLAIVIVLLSVVIALVIDLIEGVVSGRGSVVLVVVLAILVLLLIGGLRRVRRAAAAVGDLIGAAERIEAGDYAVRVPERGPREVRSLAGAFNAMSARLEATEAERRRLLADVSHELRTPLTVIQGSLEGVLDGLYAADEAHLTPILDETRVMSRLIDDLRTLASAEAGSLSLHREPVDLAPLMADVAASFRPGADAAGVTIEVREAPDLPTLDVDPERIRQVLANLIANALRHTPAGGRIELSAVRDGREVVVSVSDTGAGMTADVMERIFERFYRSPDSAGSGLGLPIARGLVRAHGGEMSASSAPGRGTVIRFTLPHAG
jgi:signal transduction histidine kinase